MMMTSLRPNIFRKKTSTVELLHMKTNARCQANHNPLTRGLLPPANYQSITLVIIYLLHKKSLNYNIMRGLKSLGGFVPKNLSEFYRLEAYITLSFY